MKFHAALFALLGWLSANQASMAQSAVSSAESAFHSLAQRPPMGWNSRGSFGTTLTEAQARENARVMAEKLKSHGYEYFVVDIQWYEPNATGFTYRKGAPLTLDKWGRLLPAPNRFPSAAHGAGFRPLADYVHSLGLKFGVHLMRGIPRQAVSRNLPIRNTSLKAADIANLNSVCDWNTDMYGVDMSKPGAQAYYDSVFALLASWEVDFVKADDMSRSYHANIAEIEAVRHAIDRSGRPMVLSLSPGETPLTAAGHVRDHANMWRISDDFRDTWPALLSQFKLLENWNAYRGPGHWPDADMLPLGVLELGKRSTRFTRDEQITLMTLWSIARSPLMMGGDLRKLDDDTLALLTNAGVLAVNQNSSNNQLLWNRNGHIVWTASAPKARAKYVALFNTRDRPAGSADAGERIELPYQDLGFIEVASVRDLWAGRDINAASHALTPVVPWHGAALYRVTPRITEPSLSRHAGDIRPPL